MTFATNPDSCGAGLLQLIAEKSATAEGFFTADAKAIGAEKNAAKKCREHVAAGVLFRVRAGQTTYAHFTTQAMANAYMHRHRDTVLARAAATLSFAPKAVKPPKVVAEPIHTPQTRYISRMMPEHNAVVVPYRRIGQPGFSMSI